MRKLLLAGAAVAAVVAAEATRANPDAIAYARELQGSK